jgi:hypothetical protein
MLCDQVVRTEQHLHKYMYIQDRKCTCKNNIEARSWNHCCSGKAINITYSEYVFVALGILHTKRMLRIIPTVPSAACPFLQYFFQIIS